MRRMNHALFARLFVLSALPGAAQATMRFRQEYLLPNKPAP